MDSTGMIDAIFTSKDVNAEIGSADEPAIDDTTDPSFGDYSYFPERDPSEITETGSWPPRGKSKGFECLAEKEGIEVYEPSKSQPGSCSKLPTVASILEEQNDEEEVDTLDVMGRVKRKALKNSENNLGAGQEEDWKGAGRDNWKRGEEQAEENGDEWQVEGGEQEERSRQDFVREEIKV